MVVGNGMVGARLAEEIRRRDPGGERVSLTVLGAEVHPAYNRVLLSTVLAGGLSAPMVALPVADGVSLHTGVTATALDRTARVVHDADGGQHPYDELVLATGCRAWLPPVDGFTGADGAPADGVSPFRDLDDCERILAVAAPGARIAVVGGGLLGVEAARGLAGRGVAVTLVHPCTHLMERQLDAGAGAVLADALRGLGVDVRCGVGAKAWDPETGLDCDDGSRIAADAVVVAAGVRAETGLAADAGLAVDRGILVDDRLATDDGRVHAIGDCAQHPDAAPGLVQSGWEQAAVLADLLTGADPAARYRGTRPVTRLKAAGIDLAAIGDVADGDERLHVADPRRGRYGVLSLRDDRVVGAVMMGLPDAAATVIGLYDSGAPAPEDRLALLLGRALPGEAPATGDPGRLPGTAVVCRCNTVTKNALVTAWREGARDVGALSRRTRAATGCGSCRDAVGGIRDWLEHADPSREHAV
ncbi:assimilatory nitrate reductase electron transfer subunit [Pseudonocardia autotrophica]|uniref:Nitrite reductase [NAD(P)H] n=2 Tax=Pseudonocardia TaxID=1847 RepID=A0A1Y2N5L7_PSEAH|nr:Nitrite reductase [NAD(P)H] [Pseudonocardia autotrophica]TDN76010.1 assimilatory nitrate reductase electron transfer subunit [Pseudonocardia autotrophica]BBF99986.1 FAD/NAD(P)-binding oxidoreductase [Pseudonocardia autotrophica]GEC25046.1 FAD/NAD(P)-binding oxidoreductase [Pseudonocardia saturnea]